MIKGQLKISLVAVAVMLLVVSCMEKDAGRRYVSNEVTVKIISDAVHKSQTNQEYSFEWEEGDRFTAVYNTGAVIGHNDESYGNNTADWSKEMILVNANGTLTLNVPDGCTQALLIYYGRQSAAKYQYVSGYGRSCIRTKLDSMLTYDSSRHLTKNNTAIGAIDFDNKTVSLKGCMSLLKVDLPTGSGVTAIKVSGNGVFISGYPFFDVRGTYHDKILSDLASDKFTLTSIDPEQGGSYYIPLLPANYRNGITVNLMDENNDIIISKTMEPATLKRREIYEMQLFDEPLTDLDSGIEGYEDFMIYR